MNLERFRRIVTDPRRTQEDLQQMLLNARELGDPECVQIAMGELDTRFPGWDIARSRKGRATPTLVAFRGTGRRFPTAKQAYCWLIERFIEAHPQPFTNLDWELVFVAKGIQRNYFGRSLQKMFHRSPHLGDDPNNYERLSNGWYVNLNLSNAEKFGILCKFAAVGKFQYADEWKWEVEGEPTSSVSISELL